MFFLKVSFFTALHRMQGGLVRRKLFVCPSICLSDCLYVKRVDCNKMEERSDQIFIPYERAFSLVF